MNTKHIKIGKKYAIYKTINSEGKYYGYYNTIEEAIKRRDELVAEKED